jgi:NTE family protein
VATPIHTPRLGLVLGAGSARGWAHIGVLQTLDELGVKPEIVCGCSSGALVGASYVTGHLTTLAQLVHSLTWRSTLAFMDFTWAGGGLIEGRRIVRFFESNVEDIAIENARPIFGAVATDLHSGRETWFTRGSIIDAVRASIALPGLLTPLRLRDRWLVDGSLVNPLPVSLCRALGADIIIGVSMNGDLISRPQRGLRAEVSAPLPENPLPENERSSWLRLLTMRFNGQSRQRSAESLKVALPDANNRISYADVIGQSLLVTQDFISRVRLAADPVDVLIAPDVAHISMIDFHRGAEAIEAGRRATLAVKEKIMQAANLAKNAAVRGEPAR